MENVWPALSIGVLAGVIAAGMGFLGRSVLSGLVSPLINIISQERKIPGEWETTFKKTVMGKIIENTETAQLRQIGGLVHGRIVNRSKDPNRIYKMRGTMRQGILVATYETIGSNAVLDRGAFTLRLNADGDEMTGYHAWTDDGNTEPSADEYVWRKKRNQNG